MIPPRHTFKSRFLDFIHNPFFIVTILTFVGLLWIFQFSTFNFRVPIDYSGDSIPVLIIIKTVIEEGTGDVNSHLGFPFGLHFYDYPDSNLLNILLIRSLTLFTTDPFLILNLFYFMTFFLIAWSALYACLRLGFAPPLSIIIALLFSFAPYHFFRSVSHLFLSAYYAVPLAILLAVEIWNSPRGVASHWTNSLKMNHFLICLVAGMSGIYYAFFSCFILCVAAFVSSFENKSFRPALQGVFLVLLIMACVCQLSSDLSLQNGTRAQ